MLFGNWQKNFNRLSKLCLYLSWENFSGESFLLRKKTVWYFFSNRAEFFLIFSWKKMGVWQKTISTVFRYASVVSFWGTTCFLEKFSIKYFHSNVQRSFGFSVLFLACLSKSFPVSKWTFWWKISEQINVCKFFFRNWTECCRTLTTKLQMAAKIAFYLSKAIFSWRFFYLENYKQFDNFFGNRAIGFRKILGAKRRTVFEKFQHDCQNWMVQIRRVF